MRGVARFLGTRLVLAVLTLVVISAITFFATNVVPSDPARIALGKDATPEQLLEYNRQQGLDRPVVERYVHWVADAARGRWGTSVLSQQTVTSMVIPRIGRTALLGLLAMLIAVPAAFILGVYSAQRSGKPVDGAISFSALFINSLPEFVVAVTLLVVFGVELGWLPIESSGVAFGTGLDVAKAYILPVLTLATVLTPYMTRMIRANVRDVAGRPFIRSAVLRGLTRRRVVWRHVVPNASLPVVNVIALSMAELIGGVVVIETVFGFPGIGQLLVDSVGSRDIPTVQVIALIIGAGVVGLNFVADGIVLLLNPQLRSAKS
jgi:peptide/nickel transport system permease protein